LCFNVLLLRIKSCLSYLFSTVGHLSEESLLGHLETNFHQGQPLEAIEDMRCISPGARFCRTLFSEGLPWTVRHGPGSSESRTERPTSHSLGGCF